MLTAVYVKAVNIYILPQHWSYCIQHKQTVWA